MDLEDKEITIYDVRRQCHEYLSQLPGQERVSSSTVDTLTKWTPLLEPLYQQVRAHPFDKLLEGLLFDTQLESFRSMHLGDIQFLKTYDVLLLRQPETASIRLSQLTNQHLMQLFSSRNTEHWTKTLVQCSQFPPATLDVLRSSSSSSSSFGALSVQTSSILDCLI